MLSFDIRSDKLEDIANKLEVLPSISSHLVDKFIPKKPKKFIDKIRKMKVPCSYEDGEYWSIGQVARNLISLLALMQTKYQLTQDEKIQILRKAVHQAEYLYTFHINGEFIQRVWAGAALSLAGIFFRNVDQAKYWRMVGFSRLASEVNQFQGENSDIFLLLKVVVECTLSVNLCILPELLSQYNSFVNTQMRYDRFFNFEVTDVEFFDELNLDYPGLEEVRKAIQEKKYDRAKREYINYLRQKYTPLVGKEWDWHEDVNLEDADRICENIITLRAHMHVMHNFGKDIDWTTVLFQDIESNVWLNAHSDIKTLARAYHQTGHKKYAHHLTRLLKSWFDQSPVPNLKKNSLQWRTLEVGNRAALRWPLILCYGLNSKEFREEVAFRMVKSYLEHARYLSAHGAPGGNWYQVETSGLGTVAALFPEFKVSETYYHLALRRFEWVNERYFFPDGFQTECSTGYHFFPYSAIASFYMIAKYNDLPLPDNFGPNLEKRTEPFVYLAKPDFTLPIVNDWNPDILSAALGGKAGYFNFKREDFKYIATRGRQGNPPKETSYAFPYAGYYVMRQKWDPQSQYLLFDGGYFGSSHQHEDKLNFILYAYGRTLIGDPGIYQYMPDEFEAYFRGPRGHNSIIVDGKGQCRFLGVDERIPDPDTFWITTNKFDLVSGWYKDGFSTRSSSSGSDEGREKDRKNRENIYHRRTIFYLKGEYFILMDRLIDKTSNSKERLVEQIFHLSPLIMRKDSALRVKPGKVEIEEGKIVVTKNSGVSNIAIIPLDSQSTGVEVSCGRENPIIGWVALLGKQIAYDVTYAKRGKLPLTFTNLLFPLPAGETQIPRLYPLKIQTEKYSAAAFSIKKDDLDDIFLMSDDGPTTLKIKNGEITFEGEVLHLRFNDQGQPQEARIVNGRLLKYKDKVLVKLAKNQRHYFMRFTS